MNSLLLRLWKALPLSKRLQLFCLRFLQDQFLVGVTGIIFNKQDQILLFKHTYRKLPWSLPGGYLKGKEHPTEGLEREIEEESGLIVSADTRLKTRTDRDTARLDMCYIGTFIGGEFRKSDEVSAYGFFSFEDLPLISRDQLILITEAIKQRNSSVNKTKNHPLKQFLQSFLR